jgi:Amt family ammonium transporter
MAWAQRTTSGRPGKASRACFYGDTSQFVCQLMGATLCAAYAFGLTFGVFKLVNAVKSMRVAPEVEEEGLDVPEFGMPAYPEDAMATV